MVKVALIELSVENLVVREEEVHGGGRKEELLLCIPSPSASGKKKEDYVKSLRWQDIDHDAQVNMGSNKTALYKELQ